MRIVTKNKFAGRLSILLVFAMCLTFLIPVIAAEKTAGTPVVISSSSAGCKISDGKGEGVEVGTKGIITRDGKDIAKFEVKQVEWGYSIISVSDLAQGMSVQVGDTAKITTLPDNNGQKKIGKKKSNVIWILLAAGALVALAGKKGGGRSTPANTTTNVTISSQKSSITADGSSNTVITANVTDSNNASVADGTAVTFSTTAGTIVPAQATTVNGRATATLTSSTTAGNATVSAVSGGKTANTTVSFVPAGSGGTSSIVVAAGPTDIQVVGSGGTQTQSTISATCRDALGNLATGGNVTFTSSIGSVIGTAAINANGIATTTFSSNATGTATITASWSGVQGTTTVNVTAGPPYSVTVECTPSSVQCDGNSFATVKATVRDVANNQVTDGTVVNFSVQSDINGGGNGTITSEARTSGGIANALLFTKTAANATSKAGTATVVAQIIAANQPSGIPVPVATINNHATQVQFTSLDVAEIHMGAVTPNIRGWDVVNNSTKIGAIVYDANHNPVPDGTAVYFTTSKGMIYGNTGIANNVAMSTTSLGRAEATLVSDASGNSSWDGLVDVTATCGAITLQEHGLVIFSGWPSPSHCSANISDTQILNLGGQSTISVVALDINGNPVVDGTDITAITSKGTITASGTGKTVGGTVMFTLATSTDPGSPTQAGAGVVTINIDSGGRNPETGGQPVVISVNFTVTTP
jgi:adhesin/invasin